MMETAKIRKAGYSIRHTYKDFAARYRVLVRGLTSKTDVRIASAKICTEILGKSNEYALGKNKIYLKDYHDRHLESLRAEIYARAIEVIQRGFRRIIFRKFMGRYRRAAIVIQKHWRAREPRLKFLAMQRGFGRLQALIHTREVSVKYQILRRSIINLQARCRGYLTRNDLQGKKSEKSRKMAELAKLRVKEEQELKASGVKEWKKEAEKRYLARLAILNKELKIDNNKALAQQQQQQQQPPLNIEDERKVVDEVFKFLQLMHSPTMETKSKAHRTTNNNRTPSFRVSRMISYLEAKSRSIKHIPSKLLSRPVNHYDNSTTRL